MIADAAGCEGWVAGRGNVRKNATKGRRLSCRSAGRAKSNASPGIGEAPLDPSATSLVYIWASFFAPVSTRCAVSKLPLSEELKAIDAFSRSSASR